MRERELSLPLIVLLAILAIITLGLGTWGWLDPRWPGGGAPIDEAFYRSLALFEINNDSYSHGEAIHIWQFRFGRWTGAAVLFSSLVALGVVLREQLARAGVRLATRRVVIVGSSPLAGAAFEAALRGREGAVWLGAPAFISRRRGHVALPWPPGDRNAALKEHAAKVKRVLIADNTDADAIALTGAIRAIARPQITVLMRDRRLAEELSEVLSDAEVRVLPVADLAARALNLAHPPFLIAREFGHARIAALIVGFGAAGQGLAYDLIVNCRTTYLKAPRIVIVDPRASELIQAWRVKAPELDACADFTTIDVDIADYSMQPDPQTIVRRLSNDLTAAYVCLNDDAKSLLAVGVFRSLLRDVGRRLPVFVHSTESRLPLEGYQTFGDAESVIATSAYLEDEAARALHQAYRASLAAERRDDPVNVVARPWESLAETFRASYREAVAHIPAMFASAGIDPACWLGAVLPRLPSGEMLFRSYSELEALAALEHERWVAQRRLTGWRAAPEGGRDDARRRHPALVPWDQMAESLKEYDRIVVRQTEAACRVD